MTTTHGHIKLSRKLFDGDPWWAEPRVFSRFEAWVDMLQLAAWRSVAVPYHGEMIPLARGEFILSVRLAARRWSWSEKAVRTFVRQACGVGRVQLQRRAHAGAVYLIVNYDTYQTGGAGKGTQGAQGSYEESENVEKTDTPKGTPKGTRKAHRSTGLSDGAAMTSGDDSASKGTARAQQGAQQGAQRGHSKGTARAQEEAVKQGSSKAVLRSPAAGAASTDWLTPFLDLWTRRVGIVTVKRCAAAIAPVRALHGDAATLAGLTAYLDEPRPPDRPVKLEWFRDDASRWIKEAETPPVIGGVLTPRGERLTRPA